MEGRKDTFICWNMVTVSGRTSDSGRAHKYTHPRQHALNLCPNFPPLQSVRASPSRESARRTFRSLARLNSRFNSATKVSKYLLYTALYNDEKSLYLCIFFVIFRLACCFMLVCFSLEAVSACSAIGDPAYLISSLLFFPGSISSPEHKVRSFPVY